MRTGSTANVLDGVREMSPGMYQWACCCGGVGQFLRAWTGGTSSPWLATAVNGAINIDASIIGGGDVAPRTSYSGFPVSYDGTRIYYMGTNAHLMMSQLDLVGWGQGYCCADDGTTHLEEAAGETWHVMGCCTDTAGTDYVLITVGFTTRIYRALSSHLVFDRFSCSINPAAFIDLDGSSEPWISAPYPTRMYFQQRGSLAIAGDLSSYPTLCSGRGYVTPVSPSGRVCHVHQRYNNTGVQDKQWPWVVDKGDSTIHFVQPEGGTDNHSIGSIGAQIDGNNRIHVAYSEAVSGSAGRLWYSTCIVGDWDWDHEILLDSAGDGELTSAATDLGLNENGDVEISGFYTKDSVSHALWLSGRLNSWQRLDQVVTTSSYQTHMARYKP